MSTVIEAAQLEGLDALVIELQVTNYAGQSARYKVTNMGTVEIIGGPEKLNKDELQTYIVELMEIYSQL